MRHGLGPTRTRVDDDDYRDSVEEKITMMIDDDKQPSFQGGTLFAELDENHFPVGEEVDVL